MLLSDFDTVQYLPYFALSNDQNTLYTLTAKMFGAKIFGENIFGEEMFGGLFSKSPKISVNNFGEKEFSPIF